MPLVPPDRRRLRASDAERDAAVEAIRRHGALGRLDLEETTERIGQALSSRTLGELEDLLSDLPAEEPADPTVPRPVPIWHSLSLWARAAELVVIDLVCLGLWVMGGGHGFWPVWVVLCTVICFSRKVTKVAEREERRRLRAGKEPWLPPWLGPGGACGS